MGGGESFGTMAIKEGLKIHGFKFPTTITVFAYSEFLDNLLVEK